MVVTLDVNLPEECVLDVPEVNLSSAALRAGSFHLGKYCEQHNNEFMLCRFEEKDPRKCLKEGRIVTACTMDFFQKVKKMCMDEFQQYANCLDKSSGDFGLKHCRTTQGVFDKCMLDNFCLERPHYGYFTRARIHQTSRPKPPEEPKAVYADATPGLPADAEKKPARFTSRFYWVTE